MNTLNQTQVSEIYEMLNALAGVCDNAMSRDGSGFSKADLIGHYIVEMPQSHFDDDWALVSLLLIRKYQRQLKSSGFDTDPTLALLDDVSAGDIEHIRTTRSTRQQRRILLSDEGDFEVYFPNKDSLRGFNASLVDTCHWISSKPIPHGFVFIVKGGARAFVADTVSHFSNWFIPDEVHVALHDESLDTIDVDDVIKYDLYILGDSIAESLTFKWDNIRRFLDTVKCFSSKSFNGKDAWMSITLLFCTGAFLF